MNNYNEIHFPVRPDFQCSQPNAVKHFPHSVESGSRWSTYGSSSGWTSEIIKAAHGEYRERTHFYLDIAVAEKATLNSNLSLEEVSEFTKALAQTSINAPCNSIEEHSFDLTHAFRISDFSPCKIPTACISISPSNNESDNNFYPFRDTCGCSTHETMEKAIHGALKESLERQFLLKFWLTKTHSHRILHTVALFTLRNSPCHNLLKELLKCGELCILDLTDRNFPGSCILICYGNKTSSNTEVKYCAGMAYNKDILSALEKALVELWQTYRFMQSFAARKRSIKEVEDPYLRHFLECNSYSTYEAILCTENAYLQDLNTKEFTSRNLIKSLRELKLNGYLYLYSPPTAPTTHFCKYISPNLFLHMNNSPKLNLINRYSENFSHNIKPEQCSKMVPFP